MTLTNQFVEHRRPFFLLEITSNLEKIAAFRLEDAFFLRSHQNPDRIVAFSSSFLEFTKPEMPNI